MQRLGPSLKLQFTLSRPLILSLSLLRCLFINSVHYSLLVKSALPSPFPISLAAPSLPLSLPPSLSLSLSLPLFSLSLLSLARLSLPLSHKQGRRAAVSAAVEEGVPAGVEEHGSLLCADIMILRERMETERARNEAKREYSEA